MTVSKEDTLRELHVDEMAEREIRKKRVGNSGCIVVKPVRGFGPYAYYVTKEKGKQTWRYLGRADKLGLVTKRVGNSEEEQPE